MAYASHRFPLGRLSMTGVGLSGESAPHTVDLALPCTSNSMHSVQREKFQVLQNLCIGEIGVGNGCLVRGTLDTVPSGHLKQYSEHLHLALALCTVLQQRPTLGLRIVATQRGERGERGETGERRGGREGREG